MDECPFLTPRKFCQLMVASCPVFDYRINVPEFKSEFGGAPLEDFQKLFDGGKTYANKPSVSSYVNFVSSDKGKRQNDRKNNVLQAVSTPATSALSAVLVESLEAGMSNPARPIGTSNATRENKIIEKLDEEVNQSYTPKPLPVKAKEGKDTCIFAYVE
ncbi:hypothetical protein BCR33DRAFT_738258 [Rhizoclosmatium globosum]|uniref:Uncharacterized protein n=1 Tax=Rhizoclosmatium globosum TaxID=329046 RepID=A0A1Y2CAN2_9FUNG|nr:hypothetical protein BCR33DRAFT_738258 [Rhizoclosmatium globosum]|eukprot:ORY44091.1 hypothetical protein BCR33DRAFT_738258 [Rhizoclosmatium globosum]